jgi:hypothetical protein
MSKNDDVSLPGMNPRLSQRTPGLLSRVLTVVVGVAAVAGAIAISIFVFIAFAIAAVLVGSYLWWKTRALRRRLREQPPPGGRIIEGEVIPDNQRR